MHSRAASCKYRLPPRSLFVQTFEYVVVIREYHWSHCHWMVISDNTAARFPFCLWHHSPSTFWTFFPQNIYLVVSFHTWPQLHPNNKKMNFPTRGKIFTSSICSEANLKEGNSTLRQIAGRKWFRHRCMVYLKEVLTWYFLELHAHTRTHKVSLFLPTVHFWPHKTSCSGYKHLVPALCPFNVQPLIVFSFTARRRRLEHLRTWRPASAVWRDEQISYLVFKYLHKLWREDAVWTKISSIAFFWLSRRPDPLRCSSAVGGGQVLGW